MKNSLQMKLISVLAIVIVFATTSYAQKQAKDLKKQPEITFKSEEHDFGTLRRGADCSFDFVFKNTGKNDLLIENVRTSCGCTTPDWTKEPIKKRQEGKITVRYDSNRVGSFSKTITVQSNAKNGSVILTIKGNIEDTL